MAFSAERLLSIARLYWRSDKDDQPGLENSPETQRLHDRWERELEQMESWRALLRDLRAELPDFDVGDATATCDSCFRCAVYLKTDRQPPSVRWVAVGCVSILAPVYAVYGVRYDYGGGKRIGNEVFLEPLPPELRVPAEAIARKIEERFPVAVLPREIAETPVPLFVEPRAPPETTLFHALFTSQPERVP